MDVPRVLYVVPSHASSFRNNLPHIPHRSRFTLSYSLHHVLVVALGQATPTTQLPLDPVLLGIAALPVLLLLAQPLDPGEIVIVVESRIEVGHCGSGALGSAFEMRA